MPIAICSSVSGPPGSTTVQGPRPTVPRLHPDPDHIAHQPDDDRERDDAVAARACGSVLYNFASQIKQPVAYYSVGFYFQDEYRVNSKLKLTMTLRADRNSGGICHSSCASSSGYSFNNMSHDPTIPYDVSFPTGNKTIIPGIEKVVFEPRFGVAWSPIGQNTVIRAGVGLFTDLYPGGLLSLFDTNFPQVNLFDVPTGSVAFDLASPASTVFPGSGVNLVTQCNGAFASNYASGGNLAGYAAAAAPLGGCLNAQGALSVPNVNDVSRNFQNPKYVEWNFEVQHTFGAHTVVSANYVGNHGYDGLVLNPTLNGFGFGNLPQPRRTRVSAAWTNCLATQYRTITASRSPSRRTTGMDWPAALTIPTLMRSMSLERAGEPFSVITSILTQVNPNNLRAQYASGDNDARHLISGSYVYQVPFKSEQRLVNAAIGGWTISGTMFYRTGFPFSIIDGGATAGLVSNNLGGTSSFGATILAQPLPAFTQRNFGNVRSGALAPCFSSADFATSTDFMGSVRP